MSHQECLFPKKEDTLHQLVSAVKYYLTNHMGSEKRFFVFKLGLKWCQAQRLTHVHLRACAPHAFECTPAFI